jgi:hypothetical protein
MKRSIAMENGHSENGDLNPQHLTEVLPTFQRLNQDARERLLQIIATFFGIESKRGSQQTVSVSRDFAGSPIGSDGAFSRDRSISAKEFMVQKDPRTDVERIACLAYYLTNYRDTPHFKTIDLSRLNTEAAQPKFSKPAFAVSNAAQTGYLVSATKGNKQLSPHGEQFVNALPDRDAAKAAMERARTRKRQRKQVRKEAVEN